MFPLQVEAKKAVPKEDNPAPAQAPDTSAQKTRKIFVGGLAPSVEEQVLRQYFEQFGTVEDAVVMYDHDNKRPRGFGFITFAEEESVDKVFARGAMQNIHDKQIEIKPAVPRDQMPPLRRGPPFFPGRGAAGPNFPGRGPGAGAYGYRQAGFQPVQGYGQRVYGAAGPSNQPPLTSTVQSQYRGGSPPHPRPTTSAGAASFGSNMAAPFNQQLPSTAGRFAAAPGNAVGSRFPGVQGTGYDMYNLNPVSNFSGGVPAAGNMVGAGASNMYALSNLQQQLNGFPGAAGVPDMSAVAGKLGALSREMAQGGVKGYGVMPGGLGGAGAFASFPTGQQQAFPAQQPDAAYAPHDGNSFSADPAAFPEAVNLPGTSPLGTTPEFHSFDGGFGAAPAPGWSS